MSHTISKLEQEMRRSSVEVAEDWLAIINQIPSLSFPAEWKVKVIPPFGGAVARFWIEQNERRVSIYLDWFSRLGCMDAPYWEIYPNKDGDTSRFSLNETEELLQAIKESLE